MYRIEYLISAFMYRMEYLIATSLNETVATGNLQTELVLGYIIVFIFIMCGWCNF